MVEIEVDYEGDLHTRSVHGPSGRVLETDAPRDNEGRGESFSPTDLLATALGTCMMTVMGIVARRHAWELAGARVRVEKHMVVEPARRIGRLVVRFAMRPGFDAAAKTTLERAAKTCPVALSIHPDIELDVAFDWPDAAPRSSRS